MEDTLLADRGVGAAGPGAAPLSAGRTFRGLTIHSVLGEGAMGYAYLASHPVLAAPVVLKTFKSGAADRLLQEARLAARARSPHVVSVLDAGIEDGVTFIVQRYVDGIDLEELLELWLRTGRGLPVGVVCDIVMDAARGLHESHLAGVVHRDIKLANVFLCGDGSAVIGDFGVALDWGNQAHEVIAGTPESMPPEQWWEGAVDGRADVYALGIAAHTLLCGDKPFRGATLSELLAAHAEQPYSPPASDDPREAYLYAVIARMLRKQAADRYPTAAAVVRALRPISEAQLEYVEYGEGSICVGDVSISVSVGDLARARARVIVNAANTRMKMSLGVARALRAAGGMGIEEQAMAHAPVAMGDVVWTSAGDLEASWVAHAASAVDGAVCLGRCALRVLIGAELRAAESVAFPAIGTGIGGVPMALGAKLVLEAIRTFAMLRPAHVRQVHVVLFDAAAEVEWRMVLQSMIAERVAERRT